MSRVSFGKLSKDLLVKHLENDLKEAPQVFVTSFSKVPVNLIDDLRKKLRTSGAGYRVVKNSLAKRVLSQKRFAGLDDQLVGQCGLGISRGDVSTVSKVLVNFADDNQTFDIKSLYLDGKIYDSQQVKEFAQLPSREELLAHVCSGLNAPIQGMVGVLSALLRNFVNVLDQIKSKKEE